MDAIRSMTRAGRANWLALFAATGTLVCCALPIALVMFGMGATVAALISQVPLLVTLSQHKEWVFLASGLLLALAAWRVRAAGRDCPADPELARRCRQVQVWNRVVLSVSAGIWGVGFFAAYLLLPVMLLLEGA